jgi:formylglycine-generating enzyme required for sulfatase activity/predicted Ser/Thr protein kinase
MLNPGIILQNRYQIIQRIGGGGMGDVYLAYDLRLGNQQVIVKENRGGDPQLFYAEATILATLRHPNLPRVSDHFVEPPPPAGTGAQYLVMDYIAGQNLEQIVQARGALQEQDALAWLNQILDAVKYLHANRIIHRDIKPQNIIITPQGNAVLVDFGIAKVMAAGRATASGARGYGSPGFAPLEQYTGGTDERSDVYALGATFYFALTGLEPPPAPDRANGVPLQPIRARNASVSPSTEQIIATAAAVVMSQRYQTVGAMQKALRAPVPPLAPSTPVPPVSVPPRAPTVPAQPRVPTWAWAVGGAGAMLFIGFVLWGLFTLIVPPAPTPAPTAAPPTAAPRAPASPTVVARVTPSPATAPPTTAPPTPVPVTAPPTPRPGALPTTITDARGVRMVFVPAGSFTMGSDPDVALAECKKLYIGGTCDRSWFDDEYPPHTVTLNAFYIDQYEVTNAQYKQCVDAGKCAAPAQRKSYTRDSYYGDSKYDNYPVIYANWEQAKTYCEWRGSNTRLPTEAEWEKAARGTDGRLYPWGNTFDGRRVNFCDRNCIFSWANKDYDDGYADTAPVGSYPDGVGPYSAYDMAGNVWEWTADWYQMYPGGKPSSDFGEKYRVVRGGAWDYFGYLVRAAYRIRNAPAGADYLVGFRCARSP